ncbi:MAG: CAP domain-containing protein [Actinobacteria bacterium]|nr:CAP domain-containing protein [Actinomycetota bacterium]
MLSLVNEVRAQGRTCGDTYYPPTGPLAHDARLAAAAQGHARDMATQDYFAHDSLDGRSAADRMTAAGYTGWRTVGENIAAGYSSAEAVMEGWLRSPGHCRNIMNPAFEDLGVGRASDEDSRYGTYWVQNFGALF